MGAGHFIPELLDFVLVGAEKILLLGQVFIRFGKMFGDAFGGGEICLEFVLEDAFKVNDGYLVEAFLTDVFGGIGFDIHLLPAGAEGEAGEELDRLWAWPFLFL